MCVFVFVRLCMCVCVCVFDPPQVPLQVCSRCSMVPASLQANMQRLHHMFSRGYRSGDDLPLKVPFHLSSPLLAMTFINHPQKNLSSGSQGVGWQNWMNGGPGVRQTAGLVIRERLEWEKQGRMSGQSALGHIQSPVETPIIREGFHISTSAAIKDLLLFLLRVCDWGVRRS